MNTKELGKAGLSFLEVGGGLTVGAIGLKKLDSLIPAQVPALARQILPGLTTAVVAYVASTKVKNEHAKKVLIGLGTGGALDVVRKVVGPRVKWVQDNVPALAGTPGYAAVNQGGTGWDYYRDNSLQGLGNAAYALNGTSMQGTSMQGWGGGMSAANSYALNGNDAYALN
jgi:hypothetical protein